MRLPDLVRRIEERFPAKGGAPAQAPLPEVELLLGGRKQGFGWVSLGLALLAGGGLVWTAVQMGWLG